MKLTKELKAEILDVYEAFWGSLLHADIQLYAAVLDADYRLVGTTEKEIFFNKQEAVHFLKSTADQMAGSLERRKSKYKIELIDGFVLITEQFDAYVLIENDWTFYGQTRVSTWMSKKAQGWKIIQQHFSFPDAKSGEGQTIGLEKISKENLELREAIKRRTIELENKNQELEIESALERVRTVAMAMQHRDDMLDICQVIAKELENLAVTDIRNIQTAIINTDKETYLNYEYFRLQKKKVITAVEYKKHKDIHAFVKRMLKDPEGFFTAQFKGASLKQWIQYQVKTGQFVDPVTKKAASLHYYFYSIGPGALGISAYAPLSKNAIALFKRFRNVFQLAYRRFMDIEKAMEQAKEAQIEASLEKVRAAAMGMHKPEDLLNVCQILFKELQSLGFSELRNAMVNIHNDEKRTFVNYDYSDEIGKTFTPLFYDIHPVIKKQISQIRKADDAFSETVFKGKDLESWKAFRKSRGEKDDKRIKNSTALYYYFYSLGTGSIGVSAFYAIGEEKLELLKRFRNVFAFAYRRYMDVAQAEAQAREAQIELALERVRARTMAMQHSEELLDTVAVMFEQFKALGEEPERMAIEIVNEKEHVFEIWATQHGGAHLNALAKISLDEPHVMQKMYKAWKSKTRSITIDLQGDELKEYFNYLKKAGLPVQRKIFGKRRVQNVATFSKGILTIITPEPRPRETIQLLERFASVFDGTYTRFLDLQKAEAQTREAQIETSLERIRAASLAMRDSAALGGIIYKLYGELTKLDAQLDRCFIMIVNPENKGITWWMAGQEGLLAENGFFVQMNQHASHLWYLDCWKKRRKKWQYLLAGKEKRDWDRFGFSKTELARLPEFIKKFMAGVNKINLTGSSDQFGSLVTGSFEPLPDEQQEIISRFTIAFNQAYIRFLDLQKAEAQAREAQIEAALERVRSRSMAMHTSQELNEVALELRKQMGLIGQKDLEVCAIHLYDKDDSFESWSAMKAPGSESEIIQTQARFPNKGIKIVDELMKHYSKGSRDYILVNEGEKMVEWFKVIKTYAPALHVSIMQSVGKMPVKKLKANWSVADFSDGALVMVTYGKPDVQSRNLLRRSANVFEQAYTRFKDLKKAEAQAREAKIEMALERVRSRSLAMHSSGELGEVVTVVLNNLLELGYIIDQGAAAHLAIFSEGTKDFFQWSADPALPHPVRSFIPYTDLPILTEFWDARQKGHDFFANVYSFEEKNTWFNFAFEHSDLKHIPGNLKKLLLESETYAHSIALEKNSAIIINSITGNKLSENQIKILRRFSKVFEQAYIRFLDLQKAEAQARESQVEAALERVRSKTMAMHKSEELSETSVVLFNELKKLNIQTTRSGFGVYDENIKAIQLWLTALSGQSAEIDVLGSIPLEAHYAIKDNYSAWKENKSFKVHTFSGKGVKDYYQKIGKYLSITSQVKYPEKLVFSVFFFSEGSLNVMTDESLTEDEIKIMLRFANVFGLTYRRFLDLQKAEGQAREAEIELALERVRSRTMAMQRSEELVDVATVLFQQVKALGVPQWNCGFNIWNTGDNAFTYYPGSPDGNISPSPCKIPLTEHPVFMRFDESRKRGDELLIYEKEGEEQADHYRYMLSLPGVGDLLQSMLDAGFELPEFQIDHLANFAYGNLIFITYEHFPGMHDVFRRFAKVFEQTYTRFLDLQKAEAQTREAQINLAVERVRARALAMYKSDEILELVFKLKQEMMNLEIPNVVAATIHLKENDGTYTMWDLTAMEVSDGKLHQPMVVQYRLEELDPQLFIKRMWDNTAPYFLVVQDEEDFKRTLQFLRDHGRTKEADETGAFLKVAGTKNAYHPTIPLHNGRMCIDLLEPPADEIEMILTRMGAAFDLAYKRFEDLKNSEAQLREAQIEGALEKVRSRTMGMQQSYELGDVATVLFKELNLLVDNLWTCGFVLCEKNREFDEWWLSTESGFIPAFNLPNTGDVTHANIYDAWKRGETYHTEQLEGQALQEHYDWLMNVPVSKKIFEEMLAAGFTLPSWQKLHCAYFSYGYLVMITQVPCTGEQIFKRFAQVFDQTYTRFLDLQKAEAQALRAEQDLIAIKEARQKAEEAFTELQSTQKQLIQSEKMASLGELTAGIAHEIQNPLNFVNNFSEVNRELIEELKGERQKAEGERNGQLEDEILNDIAQNEEKINYHGKRADAIVKGMLQHSQSSSGQKELTDINALADEYLRLAYHGLRAKDKSFNAKLETDFDPSVGMINVVTQDIGRVILNLINNAFYAASLPSAGGFLVSEIKSIPTVWLSTKRMGDSVLISVRDNGPGIPEKILDKIFQPFFTTKPTGQGTGLGLSLSYDIVKAHGGELKVETKEGEGSSFSIQIPAN